MYIDAIIIIALILIAFGWFRRFSKTVYAVATIDIFLRIIDYIANNIGIKEFRSFVNSVFPNSIPNIIGNYTSGIVYTILVWGYVVIMCFFLGYTFRAFIRKGRI